MIKAIKKEKKPAGSKRSTKWPKVRRDYLAAHPLCACCGGKKKVEVHHKKPFHLHPDLELDPTNLITLCENDDDGVNCHLLVGHLGSFKSFNVNVDDDAKTWHEKIENRPKTDDAPPAPAPAAAPASTETPIT